MAVKAANGEGTPLNPTNTPGFTARGLEILASGFAFLEGPRWRDGRLWVSDIGLREVLTVDVQGRRARVAKVPHRPSGLGFLPDGTPLVVSMTDRCLYRIDGDGLALHADLSGLAPFALNDMVVDADGRAFVGSSEVDPFEPGNRNPDVTGALIEVRPDRTSRVVAQNLAFPNGMAITPQGRLLVCESFAARLSSYAITSEGLNDRRVEIETAGGAPDGCCLDLEGGIWVALHRGERFVRVIAGSIVDTLHTPGRKAIACQLGGDDGRTLFCLTLSGEVAAIESERTAQIETVRVSVPAAGSP